MIVYLLELVITTNSQVIVEPLGIYSTEEKAKSFIPKIRKRFPSTKKTNIEMNVIAIEVDERPLILDIEIEPSNSIAKELMYFYENGIIDQVVEPDGTFSYVLTPKFKELLEQRLSRVNKQNID